MPIPLLMWILRKSESLTAIDDIEIPQSTAGESKQDPEVS